MYIKFVHYTRIIIIIKLVNHVLLIDGAADVADNEVNKANGIPAVHSILVLVHLCNFSGDEHIIYDDRSTPPMNRLRAIEHDYAPPRPGAVPARRPCAPTCAACALVPSPPTTEAAEQQRPCVNTKTTIVASSLFRFITPLRLSLLPPLM